MRSLSIGIAACAVVAISATAVRADDLPLARTPQTTLEVATGTGLLGGGAGLSASVAREIRPWFSATGNAEWGQRRWIWGDDSFSDVDKRLGYLGGGVRLRLFPKTAMANFLTMGVGAGRLSFPGSSERAEWHLVPWTGIGTEVRLRGGVHVGTEFRVLWLRRNGVLEGEGALPLRVNVRVPLGKDPK
jgi:hypothetical protein